MDNTNTEAHIISYLDGCLQNATGTQAEILSEVLAWRNTYEGGPEGNEPTGADNLANRFSKIVLKDVMRTVEGSLPSLVEPFLSENIVDVTSENAIGVNAAKAHTTLLNHQWSKKSNPLEFVETFARNLQVDGTAWTRVGWSEEGYPTVSNIPFEAVLPDPSAYDTEDARFMIYRRKVTISEILSNPQWFGEHTLASLTQLSQSTDPSYEADQSYAIGRDDSYSPDQRAAEEIELFEYYGIFDNNGDGKTEPMIGIWTQDKLLRWDANPYPDFWNPFDNAVYTRRPFSIYGGSVAALIGGHQQVRSSLMRSILDTLDASTNTQTGMYKGALDPVNYKKFMEGGNFLTNSKDFDVWQGSYNQIPADVAMLMDGFEQDEENLTGVTKYAVGTDSRSLNQTATGVSIISSMSQRRLLFTTRHISGVLARVFKKWMLMNQNLIEEMQITHDGEEVQINGEILAGTYDMRVTAGTDGLVAKKNQDLVMMMQQLIPMADSIDPTIIKSMFAELADNMDMPKLALAIKKPPQQDPEKEAMAREIEELKYAAQMAETSKNASQSQLNMANANKVNIEATMRSYGM